MGTNFPQPIGPELPVSLSYREFNAVAEQTINRKKAQPPQ
jgi:hypothetical protein